VLLKLRLNTHVGQGGTNITAQLPTPSRRLLGAGQKAKAKAKWPPTRFPKQTFANQTAQKAKGKASRLNAAFRKEKQQRHAAPKAEPWINDRFANQAGSCSAGSGQFARHWSNFWAEAAVPGCHVQCVYNIIVSVTQRAPNNNQSSVPLVSGYTVIGDATAEYVTCTGQKCTPLKKAPPQCKTKDFTAACQKMLWVPDSLIRDSLSELRFNIASNILMGASEA